MINGEGTRENSSDVASPDPPFDEFPPWLDQKSEAGDDASPASSDYSSCGESEFERYCSANSFMGTASFCSSLGACNEFLDSELGSAKSLGFGEDPVLENFGLGEKFCRKLGDKGSASLDSFDSLTTNRIEFCKEKSDLGSVASVEKGNVSVGIKNKLNSLMRYVENSSSFGATCSENNDENLIKLKVGNGSELPRSDIHASLYHDEDIGKGLNLLGGHNGLGLSPSSAESDSSQEIISAENDTKKLIKFGVVNGSNFLQVSTEDSLSYMAVCEENNTEQAHSGLGQFHELTLASGAPFDGREINVLTEAEQETSSRFGHSDDENSMVGYDTDDEPRTSFNDRRNSQYCQTTKTENENPLLINTAVAFGSDDWDEFVLEAEESSFTSVLLDKPPEQEQRHPETERNPLSSTLLALTGSPKSGGSELEENVRDIPVASCQVQTTDASNQYQKSCSVKNVLTVQNDPPLQKTPVGIGLKIMDGAADRELQYISDAEVSGLDESDILKSELLGKSKLQHQMDPLSDITVSQLCSIETETPRDKGAGYLEDHGLDALPSMVENNHKPCLKRVVTDSFVSKDLGEDHVASIEVENLELNETYYEIVNEMEEILLDSGESPGAWFSNGNRPSPSQLPKAFRDGSSTASTSGADDAYPLIQQSQIIDGVEVVGAKRKKGEVSLGERLVGLKEYTVYRLRVWSGKNQWEVERRYRDFFTLYHQLKKLFADQGRNLPSPWLGVERQSRKIFGNASPDAIAERSVLMQDCLRSILISGFSSGTPSSLIWFLSPPETLSSSSMLNTQVPGPPSAFSRGTCREGVSTLGKTISLLVEIPPHKSMKQLLEAQHYSCAGCHRHFTDGKTLLREFVETFGWGKPRLCEYTGQLFCASCHTNETAVLPAKVLHFWDFTHYPVSQLAKSYLQSIYDQPMLCVSAVNPLLLSRVPALLHIMGIRKKIGAMLPYVRCPFRRSIHKGLGSRRYLVESSDFFSLRDLVDLSKGAFAALPVMVETVSKKILEHITEQCLICCDVGVPCGARQACEDPSSLIFPFQEAEVQRCSSCESVIHKSCFTKLTSCPCGVYLEVDWSPGPTDMVKHRAAAEVDGALYFSASRPDSRSTMGFLSGLFSKKAREGVGY